MRDGTDLAARYGGEEFVLVFPTTEMAHAAKALHRLRAALAERLTSGEVPPFTCSFGMSCSDDGETLDEMLLVADRALYAAKEGGRDRIVLAGNGPSRGELDELPLS